MVGNDELGDIKKKLDKLLFFSFEREQDEKYVKSISSHFTRQKKQIMVRGEWI